MVFEYFYGGNFLSYLKSVGSLSNYDAQFYAAQIVLVVEHLHELDIAHRDIKSEAFLIDNKGYLKLASFNFAKKIYFKAYTICGTPEYMAPEVILYKGYDKGCDWWSIGVLLFELMTGRTPFQAPETLIVFQSILRGSITFPKNFDRDVKALIEKLVVTDVSKRYGCTENGSKDVFNHYLFRSMDWDELHKGLINPPYVPTNTYPTSAEDCNEGLQSSDVQTSDASSKTGTNNTPNVFASF